jgi:hypothetical protein
MRPEVVLIKPRAATMAAGEEVRWAAAGGGGEGVLAVDCAVKHNDCRLSVCDGWPTVSVVLYTSCTSLLAYPGPLLLAAPPVQWPGVLMGPQSVIEARDAPNPSSPARSPARPLDQAAAGNTIVGSGRAGVQLPAIVTSA